jgi:type I restriction enzyme S subunit
MSTFKHIAVDNLPVGWQAKHFWELANFRMGKTPPRNRDEFWEKGIHPWVSIADMKPFGTVTDTKEKVSEVAHEKVFRRALVAPGSLLMSFKLTIGRVAKVGVPTYHNEAIISFRPDADHVDSDFLFYHLAQINYRDYQDTAVKGQTLNKGKLEHLEIALPPLPEQRKIASVLGVVQRAVEQQERLIALTKELKKALLHQLFTHGLRGEPQKQTEIGPVPESWEIKRFDDFTTLQRGKDLTKTEFRHGTIPVAGSNGVIGFHDTFNVAGPGVTVGRSGSVGRVIYYPSDFWAHNTSLFVRNFHGNNPRFSAYYLEHQRLDRFRSGASVPTLDRNQFKDMLIAVPKHDEQAEIARVLETVDHKKTGHESKDTALTDLFRTLLHQLMTAQIRVHDLDLDGILSQVVRENGDKQSPGLQSPLDK